MGAADRHNSHSADFSLDAAENAPIPSADEVDGAISGFSLLDPGDYLVVCKKVEAKVVRNKRRVSCLLEVILPEAYKGRRFTHNIPFFEPNEDDVDRNKRFATLVASGMARKNDLEAMNRFKFITLVGKIFGYKMGQRWFFSDKRLRAEISNTPADFTGLHDKEWFTRKNHEHAPQNWQPQPLTDKDQAAMKQAEIKTRMMQGRMSGAGENGNGDETTPVDDDAGHGGHGSDVAEGHGDGGGEDDMDV